MSDNPYEPTKSDLEVAPSAFDIPPDVLRNIRNAWVAALVSGIITLLAAVAALLSVKISIFSGWMLFDAAFIFGLAYGIYRKSRACAVVLTVYFVISKIMIFTSGATTVGGIVAAIFLYFYARGIEGTYKYQKLMREQEQGPSNSSGQ